MYRWICEYLDYKQSNGIKWNLRFYANRIWKTFKQTFSSPTVLSVDYVGRRMRYCHRTTLYDR